VLAAGATTSKDKLARITALLHVSRMLTSELDPADIIHEVLVSAIQVIPGADAGTIYLYDEARGRLIATDTVGFGPSIRKIALLPGEGAAGRAFDTGHGEIYPDPQAVQSVLMSASQNTRRNFALASQGAHSPKAAMSAPLIFKGKALGALVVDAMHISEPLFNSFDLQMLEDFAQIAATAIVNARSYESERSARVGLQAVNLEIKQERDELDRRARALDAMIEAAKEALSLDSLASRLAGLTASQIYIFDGINRLRAGAPEASASSVAQSASWPELQQMLADVSHPRRCYRVRSSAGSYLFAAPIVAAAELLGVLVSSARDAQSGSTEVTIHIGALIAATHLIHERVLEEGEFTQRADLLDHLLEGRSPKSANSFKALPPPLRLAVGALVADGVVRAREATQANALGALRELVHESIRDDTVPAVVRLREGVVVVVWSTTGNRSGNHVRDRLADVAARFARMQTGWSTCFALCEPVTEPALIRAAFQEAMLSLKNRSSHTEPVIEVVGLGAYRLILGAATNTNAIDLSRRTLGPLLEHNTRKGADLLVTARTYFAHGGSASATAKALKVHVHTIQYRLARIEELCELSLRRAEDRLTLQLALRVFDLNRSLGSSE
jgi:GAF domain-containing protein